ncbi:type II secretion system protein [Candidatus Poribacteria bacterium]|nr:type II secretion system protein [Candidatus Poribacteria bacterium]MYB66772.1 type II secretion system protein [Candidatus Poribacteria bacterium]MYF56895.1 type II secretion system protein [Candidatus Poribacteria bacterium]MYI93300.1 type II secretion system protein [Candidatus Poribacteria bacterium]
MRYVNPKSQSGLTLVELLTSVTIIIIMGGATYAVFNTAMSAYNRTQAKLIQGQRCRVALDHFVTDVSQIQTDTSDELLTIFSQDVPTPSGNRDIVSFVTLVKTDPDVFAVQIEGPRPVPMPPLSDVRRVVYYIGPKIPYAEIASGSVPPPINESQVSNSSNVQQQEERLTLYRIVSTALNPEFVIATIMDAGVKPTVDENGMPIEFAVEGLIDGIINFDLNYVDAESGTLFESWEQTDVIPVGVQVLVSVINENNQNRATVQSAAQNPGVIGQGALTQSTMVYIPAGASGTTQ